MPKLDLQQLRLKNFRSYGDQEITINLDNLGPVLILGENINDPDSTNGVGKSSISDAIIWCLFGRLPGMQPAQISPGDHIINRNTGKNCLVEITTKDGYKIIRTRKYDGHSDLLLLDPTGTDISLSTNKSVQQLLNKKYNLDFDIFTTNTFFPQSSRPFLELPDQKRKKALERLLNLDKYDLYAKVAKEKGEKVQLAIAKSRGEQEQIDRDILRISQQLDKTLKDAQTFVDEKNKEIEQLESKYTGISAKYETKKDEVLSRIKIIRQEAQSLTLVDIDGLRKKWSTYEGNVQLISKVEISLQKLASKISVMQKERETLLNRGTYIDYGEKAKEIIEQIDNERAELEKIKKYDINKIKEEWDIFNKETERQNKIIDQIDELGITKSETEASIKILERSINDFEAKAGTTCPTCKQIISKDHVSHNPNKDELTKEKDILTNIIKQIQKLEKTFVDIKGPTISIQSAGESNSQFEAKLNHINSLCKTREEYVSANARSKNDQKQAEKKIEQLDNDIQEQAKSLEQKQTILEQKRASIETSKPDTTINEALLLKKQYDDKINQITELEKSITKFNIEMEAERNDLKERVKLIKETRDGKNPYKQIDDGLREELRKIRESLTDVESRIKNHNFISRHLNYIERSYVDRRRVKSFILSRLIPYLNERITYYLSSLGCEFKISFSSFLQVQSDHWPYELYSGGQKRRIDLAIMFAIHDLHISLYGDQCNLLVFDEYDRSLDKNGIYSFVNLLFKDFSKKNKTILVISHNDAMRDMFPTKIVVRMNNDESYIEEIR